ncbi:MAG: hypothetical protein Q8M44_05660, partial [bacterium]|nr:hypothetical protein [bacterium]
ITNGSILVVSNHHITPNQKEKTATQITKNEIKLYTKNGIKKSKKLLFIIQNDCSILSNTQAFTNINKKLKNIDL